mmetsp:Transcript_28280/g.84383  ORF Transcript_28280/g.84383 Transcript_28280/m.84383 type:complete len:273 (-) Transcript_28280:206-1024(-)
MAPTTPLFSLAGKTAVITGASRGIGYETAVAFAAAGARVHMIDLDGATLDRAAAQINTAAPGHEVRGHVCDIRIEADVERCFDRIRSSTGSLDCCVNNAGVYSYGALMVATADDVARVHATNVAGTFHCLKAAVKHMVRDGRGGCIVNVCSISSLIGMPDRFTHSMSKGALLAMTRSVATDYVQHGIRCNAVCPGRTHTEAVDEHVARVAPGDEPRMLERLRAYQPMGRLGKPHEVARCILYMCTPEAAFMTGASVAIDGGVTANMTQLSKL